VLRVRVSEALITRAMCIMDALIKRIERLGGEVRVVEGNWRIETAVTLAGEQVAMLRLRERYNEVRVRPMSDCAASM
jgi:hypothetical protein